MKLRPMPEHNPNPAGGRRKTHSGSMIGPPNPYPAKRSCSCENPVGIREALNEHPRCINCGHEVAG
jgi:hypothetical protein